MIKKIISSKKNNYFCTLAIGKKYEINFKKYTYKSLYNYCKKRDIGIILITDHLIKKS